jgi:large conductance mechanosensitive channel
VKHFLDEFKAFVSQGNVLGLAVGVIIGAAFGAIINSLVGDLIMPLLGIVTGGVNFTGLSIDFNDAHFTYGNFIQAVVNFLLIALVVFFLVKAVNKILPLKMADPPALKKCPYCNSDISETAVRCPLCTTILDPEALPLELR